jgi:L-threonylcarbamoyladenylate synthase
MRIVSSVEDVVRAVEAGALVVIPTDTVYGLACRPDCRESAQALLELKRRAPGQPIAVVAASVDALLEVVPELEQRVLDAVLPGPLTLVVSNPERRFPWLTGERPDTLGVRVPAVAGPAADLLRRVGVVAATSANLHDGADPRRLTDVPAEILARVAGAFDGGDLPGKPSTVVDLTGPEPFVLREGAMPGLKALARIARALDG